MKRVTLSLSLLEVTTMNRVFCGLAALALLFGVPCQARTDFLYWGTAGGQIGRANLDGTEITILVQRGAAAYGLALDFAGGMIWADYGRGEIRRANLDGTGQTTLIKGLVTPESPVLDLAGGQMYWTEQGSSAGLGKIHRANLDGTGLTTLVAGLSYPNTVALDLAGGKMYYADGGGYYRANLDGSGQERLPASGGRPVSSMALDVAEGKMYWTGFGDIDGDIRRANLDGSGTEILVGSLYRPTGVTLDVARGKMYWADWGYGDIRRANLDGTGQEILIKGLGAPSGIALDLRTFLITVVPSTVAGTPFDLTVTALDQSGNIDTNYQGTVTFTSSDPYFGAVPADYTFTADDHGTHTFSGGVTFFSAGAQTVTVQDTSPSAITGRTTVAVVPAPASHFLILAPATAVAGTPFDVVLAALDPYLNVDGNYTGTVTWTSSDTDPGVVLPADYTFQASDHGAVTLPAAVTLLTLGNQTLTATDPVSGMTGSVTITVGAPN
jgi:sugar lactone lactonase YvrE